MDCLQAAKLMMSTTELVMWAPKFKFAHRAYLPAGWLS